MVAIVATAPSRQKSRKRGSSLPFECRHALGDQEQTAFESFGVLIPVTPLFELSLQPSSQVVTAPHGHRSESWYCFQHEPAHGAHARPKLRPS